MKIKKNFQGFRINANNAANPNTNSHRQFFELVQQYDDENVKN